MDFYEYEEWLEKAIEREEREAAAAEDMVDAIMQGDYD